MSANAEAADLGRAPLHHFEQPGRLAGLTYPSGRSVNYSFDALGRIAQILQRLQSRDWVR